MKHKVKHIGYFALGFLFVALVMEMYLKGTGIKNPYITIDEQIGKTFQKNAPIQLFKEGYYIGHVNDYGFLGDVKKEKDTNVYRIALIGDSFSEGFQLKSEYHFSKILEQRLNTIYKNRKIEVLNFGISSVVFSQMYLRKKLLAEQFDIDLFVYVMDNKHFIYPPEGVLERVALAEKSNQLHVEYKNSKSYLLYKKGQFIIDNASYFNLIFDGYICLRRKKVSELLSGRLYDPPLDDYPLSVYDPWFQELSSLNKLILAEIEKQNSIFVIKEAVHPLLKERLVPYAIPIIETVIPLEAVRKTGQDPYYWPLTQTQGHWNYFANETIGIYLSKQLIPYLDIDKKK